MALVLQILLYIFAFIGGVFASVAFLLGVAVIGIAFTNICEEAKSNKVNK